MATYLNMLDASDEVHTASVLALGN